METIFTLNMEEEEQHHHQDTSQLLQDCLNKLQSPTSRSTTTATTTLSSLNHHTFSNRKQNNHLYNNHPDIQYFQKIKTKNHFNYHKSKHQTKWNIDKISSTSSSMNNTKMNDFDPYNLELLLLRIKSFNSLNWKSIDPSINELKCSINGWKCVSFGIKESKNHLICTFCNQQLILKYPNYNYGDTLNSNLQATPFDYNVMSGDLYDDESFNQKLIELYLKKIESDGHDENCLWRNFEISINDIYYLRHYLSNNDDFLIIQYCKNLKNLIDNLLILEEYSNDSINNQFLYHQEPGEDLYISNFIKISNQWLLSKYFNENKENFNNGLISYNIPSWIYKLAIYGWSLNVQTYANDVILLMSCNMCNERIFLNSTKSSSTSASTSSITNANLNLSSSKILTPVAYPMLNTTNEEDIYDSCEHDSKFDPKCNHKPWCSYLHNDLPKYFIQMMLESEKHIGVNGEFIYDANNNDLMNIDTSSFNPNLNNNDDLTNLRKRRKSFTVNEGLERLSKLRKLYLIDE